MWAYYDNLQYVKLLLIDHCTRQKNVNWNDIGLYVNKPATESIDLIPGLRYFIWTPPEDYKFPVSEKRYFKFQRS
jgi:hypothetical protein